MYNAFSFKDSLFEKCNSNTCTIVLVILNNINSCYIGGQIYSVVTVYNCNLLIPQIDNEGHIVKATDEILTTTTLL